MLRQSAAIAFVLLVAAPDPAFAHGGNLKGPDGSTIPDSDRRSGRSPNPDGSVPAAGRPGRNTSRS